MADEQATEVPAVAPPETPPEKPKAEPDYKTQAAEREKQRDEALAKLAKQENDLRSLRGSRERDVDIRDSLTTIREYLGHQNEYIRHQDKKLDVLAKALAIEDPALGELKEQRLGIEQAVTASKEREAASKEKGATSQRAAEFEGWLNGEEGPLALLRKTNTGEDGKPILDLDGPELAAFGQRWTAEVNKLNDRGVLAALFLSMEAINKAKREKEKAVAKSAPKPAKEEEPDLDTGPGAGGGGQVSDDQIDAAWVKYDREHPGKENPYDAQYRRVLGR